MKLKNNLTFESIIQTHEDQHSCSFDSEQLKELKAGYESGLHIDAYADPIIDYLTMFSIRRAIEDRREYLSNRRAQCRFAQYVYDGFDEMQLDELAIGLSRCVSVDLYAHRSLNHEEMHIIRRGLEMGINVLDLVHNGHDLIEIHQMLGDDTFL